MQEGESFIEKKLWRVIIMLDEIFTLHKQLEDYKRLVQKYHIELRKKEAEIRSLKETIKILEGYENV